MSSIIFFGFIMVFLYIILVYFGLQVIFMSVHLYSFYSRRFSGEPSYNGTNGFCLQMFNYNTVNGTLNDINCDNSFYPLCKLQAFSSETTTIRPQKYYSENLCPSSWIFREGHCYKIFDTKITQFQAEALCRANQQSSYLAQITDDDEFYWMQEYVQKNSTSSVWVSVLNF